jgi:hypothetical protein
VQHLVELERRRDRGDDLVQQAGVTRPGGCHVPDRRATAPCIPPAGVRRTPRANAWETRLPTRPTGRRMAPTAKEEP